MEEFCFRHYVVTREDGSVTDGWSTGVKPERDTTGAVCINQHGGYQFEIVPGGDGLPICCERDVPIYKWDGTRVMHRTDEEIQAELDSLPAPPPTPDEDRDAMIIDHELRLTMLELGV